MTIEEGNLFKGMPAGLIREINAALVSQEYEEGALLYIKGSPAENLYILVEGRVRVTLGDQGQIAIVVSITGDAIGWSSLLENESHSSSAECLVRSRVLRISREKLAAIFDSDPVSGLQFYRGLAKHFRQQLMDTYRLIPASHGEKKSAPGF